MAASWDLRTLATKDDGQVPELGHVVCFKHLALIRSTISVERQGDVVLVLILAGECDTSANGYLSADDTVSTIEAGSEHVHGSTLAVGDTLSPAKQLTNDGLDASSAHQGEAVAAVGGDEMVRTLDGMLDSDGDSLLARGQVAEAADLLLLVEPVGGHLHASAGTCQRGLLACSRRH